MFFFLTKIKSIAGILIFYLCFEEITLWARIANPRYRCGAKSARSHAKSPIFVELLARISPASK